MTFARVTATSILLAAFAVPVAAHTGADAGAHHGFLAGLLHPFTGVDHLLAMLAVGFAAAMGGRGTWLPPAAFAVALLAGALLAAAGVAIPAVEPMIAASLLVFGLLLAARSRIAALAIAAPAALFGIFHGAAHAYELAGSTLSPIAGMLAGSALLLAAGAGMGAASRRHGGWWSRAAGIATSLAGVALLVSMATRA